VDKKFLGVSAILLASLMWAIEPIFAKYSYYSSDFLYTSAIRAVVAAATAAMYILITKKGHFRIERKKLPSLLYIAVLGTLFADLMYFYALTQVPVINAVIIGHLQPIFIILFAFLLLKDDKLIRWDYVGILLMVIAGIIVTTKTFDNFLSFTIGTLGDLFVLSATIAWATTAIIMRKYLRDVHAGTITFYRFSFASLIFFIYLGFTASITMVNMYQIGVGFVVGLGTILYYEGLKRLKAAQVSGLELSTPFFAAILGFYFLQETVTVMQIGGILLLIIGIYCLSKREEPDDQQDT